jgi:hypothetical protein
MCVTSRIKYLSSFNTSIRNQHTHSIQKKKPNTRNSIKPDISSTWSIVLEQQQCGNAHFLNDYHSFNQKKAPNNNDHTLIQTTQHKNNHMRHEMGQNCERKYFLCFGVIFFVLRSLFRGFVIFSFFPLSATLQVYC